MLRIDAPAAAARRRARRFLTATPRPDPRLLQAIFSFWVALDVLVRAAVGAGYAARSWPAVGLLLVAVAFVLSCLVPWRRAPRWTRAVLPLLDVAALGLIRLDPVGRELSDLLALPVVWLAWQFGRRGAATAAGAVTVFHVLPALTGLGAGGLGAPAALLLLGVAGGSALAVALVLETLGARDREVADRDQRLQEVVAELRREQQVHRTMLDTVDVGLALVGPDGSFQVANTRLRELMALAFPHGHSGVAGDLGEVFAEDGTTPLAPEEMPSWRAGQGEEFQDLRFWVGSDPALRRAMSASARTVQGAVGGFGGAALAFKDVTDLLDAMLAKDQFVATVSHELRTPLTSILGYLDLVLDRDDLDPVVARQLRVVERNGHRLLALVGDLLHTAQLSTGNLDLDRGGCDLVTLVRECVAAAGPAAATRRVRLVEDVPPACPAVLDRGRIGQVVDNLLSNAVKYNRDGGRVVVRVCAGNPLEPGTVLVEVSDNGCGMSPAEQQHLFTPFYRARHAVDHAIPGVGLGLSICQTIVEGHGGRIEFESAVDVGTAVRMIIPLRDDAAAGAFPQNDAPVAVTRD